MLFVQERIRLIDRLIGEAIGPNIYKPGVLYYPEVVWTRELVMRDGKVAHTLSSRISYLDLQQLAPDEIAAKVIGEIEIERGKLEEALRLAQDATLASYRAKVLALCRAIDSWCNADCRFQEHADVLVNARLALRDIHPEGE